MLPLARAATGPRRSVDRPASPERTRRFETSAETRRLQQAGKQCQTSFARLVAPLFQLRRRNGKKCFAKLQLTVFDGLAPACTPGRSIAGRLQLFPGTYRYGSC